MPKRIKFDKNKFIDAHQAKNEFGYIYKLKDLARIFKISLWSVNKYSAKFGLSRYEKLKNR